MVWLPLFWIVCFAAGYVYTAQKGVPLELVLKVAPAFLLEATLFLWMGVERWREPLNKRPRWQVALFLIAAAVAPYTLASVVTGTFEWGSLAAIAALAVVVSGWYLVLPAHPASDIGLLVMMAAVVLLKVFDITYRRPDDRLAIEVLGQAMWIRTGLFAMLSIRRVKGVGFGFWPSRREWGIGALYFLGLLPVAAGLARWLGFAQFKPPSAGLGSTLSLIVLTFFGVLWVVALSEEFFFRGLMQQWFTHWLKNEWGGLVVASLLFGAVHVFYHFPNPAFAALAAVAGVFYGLAFRQAGSIRASMVTHALTVTTWRVFFNS